jgi:DNA-binding NarL/FixJ family response regulator
MRRARILLADDHTMVVEALQHLLQSEFDIVGTVSDGHALLKAAARLRPDVAVVDIGMPLLNGLDAGRRLKSLQPALKIVYITQSHEPRYADAALNQGASGYLLKSSAASELKKAIKQALKGACYVSPAVARQMSKGLAAGGGDKSKLRELTPRMREVLQLIAEGKHMKEVAAILGISHRTVEFHKYRIMRIVGAKTNAELVRYAIKHGLIQAP